MAPWWRLPLFLTSRLASTLLADKVAEYLLRHSFLDTLALNLGEIVASVRHECSTVGIDLGVWHRLAQISRFLIGHSARGGTLLNRFSIGLRSVQLRWQQLLA